jgi:hypothetical protein
MKQIGDKIRKISATVRQAFAEAGLDFDALRPGVIPLFEIISAYPLRVATLPEGRRLTARSAIEFLGRETGKELPLPRDGERPLSGFIYVFEYEGFYNGCIFTEWNDPITRRRFSAAHELAHYLIHFQPLLEQRRLEGTSEPLILTEGISLDVKDETREVPAAQMSASEGMDEPQPLILGSTPQEQEREANLFAAELLMPAHVCEELARQYAQRFNMKAEVRVRLLARDLFVSAEAMTRRLKELGLYT